MFGRRETKISIREVDDGTRSLIAEHREAEASRAYQFRLAWDHETRSLRLRLVEDEQQAELDAWTRAYMAEHPDDSKNDIWKASGKRKQDVLDSIRRVEAEVVPEIWEPPGTTPRRALLVVPPRKAPLSKTKGLTGTTGSRAVPETPEPGGRDKP